PMCAEPVRNVRSNPAGGFPGLSSMPPVLKWVVGGMVLAVLGVAGCCGMGMWRMNTVMQEAQEEMARAQAQREADRQARLVVVSAADLLREFQTDPAAAEQKYLGKYLEISGVVERVGHARYEAPFVILHGVEENAKLKVVCYFELTDPQDDLRIKRLGKGQKITIRGDYDGRVDNLQVRECTLIK
ncbi:MAG TPA: hypothetical protein VKE40_04840, partial [Gemmataceae bacterium]|nr:hypothetical protein [Gemmataceae bacterium]